jgi:hypothetical protein
MALIKASAVRELAKENNKRVGRDYLQYLEKLFADAIRRDCHRLGSRKTLNRADAAAARSGL